MTDTKESRSAQTKQADGPQDLISVVDLFFTGTDFYFKSLKMSTQYAKPLFELSQNYYSKTMTWNSVLNAIVLMPTEDFNPDKVIKKIREAWPYFSRKKCVSFPEVLPENIQMDIVRRYMYFNGQLAEIIFCFSRNVFEELNKKLNTAENGQS